MPQIFFGEKKSVHKLAKRQYHLFLLCLFLFGFGLNKIKAQTVLSAGDIVFTGYIGSAAPLDEFSFVILKNIASGTVITFTDNAWLNTGVLRTGEQIVLWTANAALVAGTEILISGPGGGAATVTINGSTTNAGTCSGTMPSLSTNGDQVLAYQGVFAAPFFISAIHMNVYTLVNGDPVNTTAAVWDGTNSNNVNASALPTGLTTGVNAVWIGVEGDASSEYDNARFNCTGPLSTAAEVRAAVNNQANWIKENGVPTIVIPTGCNFMGILPVTLLSFTGKLNHNKTVSLQWKVAEQQGIRKYIVEQSSEGSVYKQLGSVAASNGTVDTYSYIDWQVSTGNNYYRLKIEELSGKITYSNIIVVNLKAGSTISLYPNPVKDRLMIKQFGTIQNKIAVLIDVQGKVMQKIILTNLQQTMNMDVYPAGIYILKMEDGTIFKVIKQ